MGKDVARFEEHRAYLFAIAYRMLGTVADAEDIVQDAFVRYQAIPADTIVSTKAFLTTVVTRLCLNQLQSAHHEREHYIGPWLPEPIQTVRDPGAPTAQAELRFWCCLSS
jgi:RNA polymerase sigma-70 factor (ECF subfamily)